jgi:hypothetical protein
MSISAQIIPDWLHHPSAIADSALPAIQHELLSLFEYLMTTEQGDPGTLGVTTSGQLTRQELLERLPATVQELARLRIDRYLEFVGIFWLRPGADKLPIHIDDPSGAYSFALNIPVQNCHESWTVWYDAEIDYDAPIPEAATAAKYDPGGRVIRGTAREIDRVNSGFSSWVNISVPHRGITLGQESRLNASLRFNPAIKPLIFSNYFQRYLIRQN